MTFPSNPAVNATYTNPQGQAYVWNGAAWVKDVAAAANPSSITDSGDGRITHDDGGGTTKVIDIPAQTANHINDAEARVLLKKQINAATIATAVEIAGLSGDEDVLIELDNGEPRRIPVDKLPINASTSSLSDNGDGSFSHDDGEGNTISIDIPSRVANHINPGESAQLFNALVDNTPAATVAEIAALTGNEFAVVELASGTLARVPLKDANKVSGGTEVTVAPASTSFSLPLHDGINEVMVGYILLSGAANIEIYYSPNGVTTNVGDRIGQIAANNTAAVALDIRIVRDSNYTMAFPFFDTHNLGDGPQALTPASSAGAAGYIVVKVTGGFTMDVRGAFHR
jgi:hypothetical protein